MGINIGALAHPTLWLQSVPMAGPTGLALLALACSLAYYFFLARTGQGHGDPLDPGRLNVPAGPLGLRNVENTISVTVSYRFCYLIVLQQPNGWVHAVRSTLSVVRLATCDTVRLRRAGKNERPFFLMLSALCSGRCLRTSGSMTLFADRATDLSLFKQKLTAAQFGSANAIFIIHYRPVC